MRKLLLSIIFVFFIGCSKEKQENIQQDINQLMNINNYLITKRKVNDSIYEVKGENKDYIIAGHLNENNNKKEGWFLLNFNNPKKDTLLNVEYITFNNKEFLNQYLFFDKNKINLIKSKFYKNNIVNKNYMIHFNLPKDNLNTDSCTFTYYIIKNNNLLSSNKITGVDKFDFNIDLREYPKFDFIKGVFSCYASEKKGDSIVLGNTQIYTIFEGAPSPKQ
ncbi:MAG: hypothetical protein KA980_07025 [Flavobacterium sp.]|jgi:hypothetical protein|nr:hypothetical protein [Flavobacterium sp.]MBP7317957.1 hypothetical protein [Flavobacterium sp.]